MAENRHDEVAAPVLARRALLYASGAVDEAEAAEFETWLGDNQRARDALCRAVEYLQSCAGTPMSRPDPAYRVYVHRRLARRGGWLRGLFHRRSYRGHPMAWSALGAAAALAFVLVLPGPLRRDAGREFVRPSASQVAEDAPALNDEALIWAQMPRSDHLLRVHQEEEIRRKQREGLHPRLARVDEDRLPRMGKNRIEQ